MTHEVVRAVNGREYVVQRGQQAALVFVSGQVLPEKSAPATNVTATDDQRGRVVVIGGMRCIEPLPYWLK